MSVLSVGKDVLTAPWKAAEAVQQFGEHLPGEIGDAAQKPSINGAPKAWWPALWKWGPLADAEAKKYHQANGTTLLAKIIKGESNFSPGAVSKAGARGAGQFMSYTRAEFITKYGVDAWSSNPDIAVHAVALFIKDKGLAAYNPNGGQQYINYILGQKVSADQNNSALVPDAIEGATDSVGDLIHILTNPSELGALAAKASAFFIRLFGKAMWDYAISPPWHWTERATDYYFYNLMSGEEEGTYYSSAGIITMLFWGMGFGILWSSLDDDGISPARRPRDSMLGRTVQSAQLGTARRKLRKPGSVGEETPDKPEATETTIEIIRVRTVAANRRRAVRVSDAGGEGNDSSERRDTDTEAGAGTEVGTQQPNAASDDGGFQAGEAVTAEDTA